MIKPELLSIKDFTYDLPENNIASFPLAERSSSKLLKYHNGSINHFRFSDLPEILDEGSSIILNNTKVIQARLIFHKETGAKIEIFCLEPEDKIPVEQAFQTRGNVLWKCMIGNAKKWKDELLSFNFSGRNIQGELNAARAGESSDSSIIKLSWFPAELTFAEVLSYSGLIPLPPYLNRDVNDDDKKTYNTIYAKLDGSVAAPTSGLHFTDRIFSELHTKNITTDYVTLHVGAGTFKPVKALALADHVMHEEQISVSLQTIKQLSNNIESSTTIAVGTTTLRTLESLYWHAVEAMKSNTFKTKIEIDQWFPYKFQNENLPTAGEAMKFLYAALKDDNASQLTGFTKILIAPGYKIRMTDALITNFHQPESTLLLLVAALIGDDWKKVYASALENNYRFLSYGDSSILFKS